MQTNHNRGKAGPLQPDSVGETTQFLTSYKSEPAIGPIQHEDPSSDNNGYYKTAFLESMAELGIRANIESFLSQEPSLPTTSLHDKWNEFIKEELEESKDKEEYLVRPSGSLNARLGVLMHHPTWKTATAEFGETADPSNPCTALVINKLRSSFEHEHLLMLDLYCRRVQSLDSAVRKRGRSAITELWTPKQRQIHQDFSSWVMRESRAKVWILFGSFVRDYFISRTAQSLQLIKIPIPASPNAPVTEVLVGIETSETQKILKVVIFVTHPESLFYLQKNLVPEKGKKADDGFNLALSLIGATSLFETLCNQIYWQPGLSKKFDMAMMNSSWASEPAESIPLWMQADNWASSLALGKRDITSLRTSEALEDVKGKQELGELLLAEKKTAEFTKYEDFSPALTRLAERCGIKSEEHLEEIRTSKGLESLAGALRWCVRYRGGMLKSNWQATRSKSEAPEGSLMESVVDKLGARSGSPSMTTDTAISDLEESPYGLELPTPSPGPDVPESEFSFQPDNSAADTSPQNPVSYFRRIGDKGRETRRQQSALTPYTRQADQSQGDALSLEVKCKKCGKVALDDNPLYTKATGLYIARPRKCCLHYSTNNDPVDHSVGYVRWSTLRDQIFGRKSRRPTTKE